MKIPKSPDETFQNRPTKHYKITRLFGRFKKKSNFATEILIIYKNEIPQTIADEELALRLEAFAAVQITGPKWYGKTTTAEQHAKSIIKMQNPDKREGYLATAKTKPSLLLKGETPRLAHNTDRR